MVKIIVGSINHPVSLLHPPPVKTSQSESFEALSIYPFILSNALSSMSDSSALIISDYNKGLIAEEDIQYICNNHKLTFLDTKKILGDFCLGASYININNLEYSKSKPFIDEDAFYEKLVITLGPKGCKYKDKIYPVEKTEVIDQVGAGDTFIAALAVKFLENNQILLHPFLLMDRRVTSFF